jgi:hypothetical protein
MANLAKLMKTKTFTRSRSAEADLDSRRIPEEMFREMDMVRSRFVRIAFFDVSICFSSGDFNAAQQVDVLRLVITVAVCSNLFRTFFAEHGRSEEWSQQRKLYPFLSSGKTLKSIIFH